MGDAMGSQMKDFNADPIKSVFRELEMHGAEYASWTNS